MRADSAFYCHGIIATARRAGPRFSVTARLIVRRVRRLNPATIAAGQPELFALYRYHAVFSPAAPNRCWQPRPPTATTPSSNRSSPT